MSFASPSAAKRQKLDEADTGRREDPDLHRVTMDDFPDEILCNIFSVGREILSRGDTGLSIRRVCRRFREQYERSRPIMRDKILKLSCDTLPASLRKIAMNPDARKSRSRDTLDSFLTMARLVSAVDLADEGKKANPWRLTWFGRHAFADPRNTPNGLIVGFRDCTYESLEKEFAGELRLALARRAGTLCKTPMALTLRLEAQKVNTVRGAISFVSLLAPDIDVFSLLSYFKESLDFPVTCINFPRLRLMHHACLRQWILPDSGSRPHDFEMTIYDFLEQQFCDELAVVPIERLVVKSPRSFYVGSEAVNSLGRLCFKARRAAHLDIRDFDLNILTWDYILDGRQTLWPMQTIELTLARLTTRSGLNMTDFGMKSLIIHSHSMESCAHWLERKKQRTFPIPHKTYSLWDGIRGMKAVTLVLRRIDTDCAQGHLPCGPDSAEALTFLREHCSRVSFETLHPGHPPVEFKVVCEAQPLLALQLQEILFGKTKESAAM